MFDKLRIVIKKNIKKNQNKFIQIKMNKIIKVINYPNKK
jgi:hypothetical protein